MGAIIITIVEICNGVSLLSSKELKLQEILNLISMCLVVAYIGIVYGEPYLLAALILLVVCLLMSRDVVRIILACICVSVYLLSHVILFTNLNLVLLSSSLLIAIVALSLITALLSIFS